MDPVRAQAFSTFVAALVRLPAADGIFLIAQLRALTQPLLRWRSHQPLGHSRRRRYPQGNGAGSVCAGGA